MAQWRIGRVVAWGLHVTLLGFGVIAIYSLLEDATQTARVASGLGALIMAVRTWRSSRPSAA